MDMSSLDSNILNEFLILSFIQKKKKLQLRKNLLKIIGHALHQSLIINQIIDISGWFQIIWIQLLDSISLYFAYCFCVNY